MNRIIVLGSAYSIPDAMHDNTHLLVQAGEQTVLVDCASNPVVRLSQVGVDPLAVTSLILTHFHPDHVYGVPLLLMDLWLLGKKTPLCIYGLPVTLAKMESQMDLFGWREWPGFFPVSFEPFSGQPGSELITYAEVCVSAATVCHMIPTLGLRFDFLSSGKSLAYSCDTEPCAETLLLASHVDVLIHEAAGAMRGHSSPAQAADIASQAGAKSLYLIHYPTRNADPQRWVKEAAKHFSGSVALAEDFLQIDL